MDLLGPRDGLLHGKRRADLPHRVVGVNHQRRAGIAHDPGPSRGVDTAASQLAHIFGHPQHAVRMHAAQVGEGKRSGQQSGVGRPHFTTPENARHKPGEFI